MKGGAETAGTGGGYGTSDLGSCKSKIMFVSGNYFVELVSTNGNLHLKTGLKSVFIGVLVAPRKEHGNWKEAFDTPS